MNKTILKIISLQVVVTIIAALVSWFLADVRAAYSAAFGGGIGFVPAFAYAFRTRRTRGQPRDLVRAHYSAEALKFVLTLLMFTAAFAWIKNVSIGPLMGAYVATLAVYWLALIRFH